MAVEFEVEDPGDVVQATLTVTALVSKLGASPGYAPMTVRLQGKVLAEDLTVPGGGDLPHDNVFAVPGDLLRSGVNTLEIESSPKASSMLWLYRITMDPVWERGRSERARVAETARDSVFAFRTELRPAHASSASWQPAPRLLFHVDRGERSLPAQLSWRGEDGAEATVGFAAEMSGFLGCYRAQDGTAYEYRGDLTERWPFSDGTESLSAAILHRFHTEEGWAGDWHRSAELRVLVDDGGAPVERVSWRDQRGNSGTAVLHTAFADVEVTGVEASDEFDDGGEGAGNLLDERHGKWLCFDDSAQLDFALARPAAVASYSLTSANDAPDRDPRDWTLHGSHDGRTWTPLDTRTGETFAARWETREFALRGHTRPYRHYRLDITRNSGSAETQLARVRFAGAPAGRAFTGYYQRSGEGPIGYRGTPVAAPAPTAVPGLASELEAAVSSLTETSRTLAALAAQLRRQ
ncbi:alpha-1,2-mannosidase [Streptomyces fuscichromogenes]|uniref:alpha-1,2-mannosidase n=1 Tax=Streptomyces fuscichromogenes TaxID=1324013 RepID=UPI0038206569